MENVDQIQQLVPEKAASITWHDLSLGLWGSLLALSVAILKFISWFSTREVKRFWKDIEVLLDAKIKVALEEQTKKMEEKLVTRDNKIEEITEGVATIRRHYHDKNAMEMGVLSQLLTVADRLDQKTETQSPNKSDGKKT